ncbi:bifunctional phosphopantothenoylcysteine decarboxylase/phosphopantothenate--cysteine ligase CoaBC [Mangrovibacillus cuniculi]|uniref:Coenzyme A biosynthesis bifunctional protein CoaBC n=2 Tax=Mangrovibacillus cuniculi TaxID=2593652 RepID=A0A7S8HEW7_9BACI|nr:bifunctional phosphopantothenoylcysteine decarboxylase/phosphopantothenate--cysteine ligase CoaBC [Mangrovibacillus cuniculi]QPC46294.1 bifunctional phosphopantothenoylcysteine decarboxylase/phosphopantothenate--cysteine ligase CoaBC [Mangrovibacillus cuniculi]
MNGKKILLGVTGGIAAYKAIALTSKLTQAGAQVRVILTEGAQSFVTPLSFQAISRQPVYTDTFDEKDPSKIAHIDLADWADLVIVAPATANAIAKLAHGLADDMLSTTLLATTAPVWIAPAMNVHMYQHPAVLRNIQQLAQDGIQFIEPSEGYLACGYVGKGRLEEPEKITDIVRAYFEQDDIPSSLKGMKIIVTSGATKEMIDPVRYITNPSTGKMGEAIAEEAATRGANVTLISAIKPQTMSSNIEWVNVTSAQDMFEEVMARYSESDIVVKSAAVSDYRPAITHQHKVKKQDGNLTIEFERTKDILLTLGEQKTSQYLVGFAAETQDVLRYAKEKLVRKNADMIVANDITAAGAGFAKDTNIVTIVKKNGEVLSLPLQSKKEVAQKLWAEVEKDVTHRRDLML